MEYTITQCLGANVKLLRQKLGLSRSELSSLVGISVAYTGMIENGDRFPSAEIIERIAGALHVPYYRLFEDDTDIFGHVSEDNWSAFQSKLESATILLEEMHDMIEVFCKHRKKDPPNK